MRRETCRSQECGERTIAMSLPAPYARSKVTSAWLAWRVVMKFVLFVPLDRIRRELATRGIVMATSTLVTLIARVADLLGPIDGHHWKQLLAGTWMATDATGLKVLVPGLSSAFNGHLEVYRRDHLVVMQYEASKEAESIVSKLVLFNGTLLAAASTARSSARPRPCRSPRRSGSAAGAGAR